MEIKHLQCDMIASEKLIEDQESDLHIMRKDKDYIQGCYNNSQRTNTNIYAQMDHMKGEYSDAIVEMKAEIKRISEQHDANILRHKEELDEVTRELNEHIEWRKFIGQGATEHSSGIMFVSEASTVPGTAAKKAKRGAACGGGAAGGGAAAPAAPIKNTKRGKLEPMLIELDSNGSPMAPRKLTKEFDAVESKKEQ